MRATASIIGVALLIGTSARAADDVSSLASDYAALVARRTALEERTSQLAGRLEAAGATQKKKEDELHQCASESWRIYWKDNLARAERERVALESQRRQVEMLRAKVEKERVRLEGARRAIEAKYRRRSRGADYEEDLRQHMAEFERRYIEPMTSRVFPAYEAYFKGADGYADFVTKSVDWCKQGNFPEAAAQATDAAIDEMSTAVARVLHLLGLGSAR